jgi:hypothetical protein
MDKLTFQYHEPSLEQQAAMQLCRDAFQDCARTLDQALPDGPDKTFVMRTLRTAAMWANVCITRHPDGAPR